MDLSVANTNMALINAQQNQVSGSLQNVRTSLQSDVDLEKMEKTASEFEAVFVSEMMKPMFEGLTTDGMFGGGKGEEVFRGILLQEYGKMMSASGSVGIADHVKATMIQMQEDANGGSPETGAVLARLNTDKETDTNTQTNTDVTTNEDTSLTEQ